MTQSPEHIANRSEQASYDIRLQGHLGAHWAAQLQVTDLDLQGDGTTLLHIVVADQSALHGLLQRIRDLGVPLISVVRIDAIGPLGFAPSDATHQPPFNKDRK